MNQSGQTSIHPMARVILTALGLAVLGYLLAPLMGLAKLDATTTFALGLAFGGLVAGALAAGITPTAEGRAPTHARTDGADGGDAPKKSVFVGNLAFKASREELQALFAKYGEVHNVRIMVDRATRRPRGFGFVEMDEPAADAAIAALDGTEFLGRTLRVNEGNDRRPRRAF